MIGQIVLALWTAVVVFRAAMGGVCADMHFQLDMGEWVVSYMTLAWTGQSTTDR
jgi:hypothetical protein